jgi:hypothetical protein
MLGNSSFVIKLIAFNAWKVGSTFGECKLILLFQGLGGLRGYPGFPVGFHFI